MRGAGRDARLGLLLLAATVVWGVIARAGALPGPFGSGWQHLGANYAIVARNTLRYGVVATRFAMVENPEPAPPEEWIHFTHHPPGMGLMTAAGLALLGDGPLAVKLPGLLFSLLQIVVTAKLVAGALSPAAGLAAAFVTAVLPAGAVYATHGAELGPQAIALALLALLLDERARARDPARPKSAAVVVAAAASLFFDWPALLIVGVIALRDLLQRRVRRAATFLAIAPLAIGLHSLHLRWATGSFAGDRAGTLYEAFQTHGLSGASALAADVGLGTVLARVSRHAQFLFTNGGLALAACGVVALVAIVLSGNRDRDARRRLWGPLAGTFALAAGYSLPFAHGVVVHRYWLIVALPWLALTIGAAVEFAWQSRKLRPLAVVALLAVGVLATRADLATQQEERTPFYEEAGKALRSATRPGEPVWTSEHVTASLTYYAERTLRGSLRDEQLAAFAGDRSRPPLADGAIAIVQPSFDPPDADCDALLEYLPRHYESLSFTLPRSGRRLVVFDLARRTVPGRPPTGR